MLLLRIRQPVPQLLLQLLLLVIMLLLLHLHMPKARLFAHVSQHRRIHRTAAAAAGGPKRTICAGPADIRGGVRGMIESGTGRGGNWRRCLVHGVTQFRARHV